MGMGNTKMAIGHEITALCADTSQAGIGHIKMATGHEITPVKILLRWECVMLKWPLAPRSCLFRFILDWNV
jgi:hypothetical protein